MGQRVVLFTGAGASRYLGYPTCRTFFAEKATTELLAEKGISDIIKTVEPDTEMQEADLERVLSVTAVLAGREAGRESGSDLPAARYVHETLKRVGALTSRNLQQALVALAMKDPTKLPADVGYIMSAGLARDLDTQLKAAVIDVFGQPRSPQQLVPLASLLKALRGHVGG